MGLQIHNILKHFVVDELMMYCKEYRCIIDGYERESHDNTLKWPVVSGVGTTIDSGSDALMTLGEMMATSDQ